MKTDHQMFHIKWTYFFFNHGFFWYSGQLKFV